MKMVVLALRNLIRNRRRSMATLLAITIGLVAVLLFGGYSRYITYGLQTGYVRHGGHLQIEHQGYFLYGTGNPVAYGIPDYQHIIQVVKGDPVLAPMIRVISPTLYLGGIAGNFAAGVSRTVIGTGVVVADQNRMRLWNDYRLRGNPRKLALTGTGQDAVVIGTGVARVLQLCRPLRVTNCPQPAPDVAAAKSAGPAEPDDIAALADQEKAGDTASSDRQIELLAASAQGMPNVARLTVVRAESQGVKALDDMAVTMHLKQAQKLVYGNSQPGVTAIAVQLQHSGQIAAAEARLNHLLATRLKSEPLEVRDFATLNPFYGQALAMFATIFGFIFVLIGAIVLFTVSNTMGMAVVERTVEIGTLRAMGLRRAGIRWMFICEGALLGFAGVVLGVMTALLISVALNHSGITWTPPGRVEPVPLTIRIWGEWDLIAGSVGGLLAVAVISAWLPARRASRLDIVEALRHV